MRFKTFTMPFSFTVISILLASANVPNMNQGQEASPLKNGFDDKGMIVNMLGGSKFLSEIEAVPEQREKIKKAIAASRAETTKALLNRSTMTKAELFEKTSAIETSAYDEIMECLLPHQKKRLWQLMAQRELIRVEGRFAKLMAGNFNKELTLTPTQANSMEKISRENDKKLKELAKRFANDVEAVLKSEKEQVYEQLTKTQIEMLDDRLGDKFKGLLTEYPVAGVLRKHLYSTEND